MRTRGYIDGVFGDTVRGWVVDLDDPATPVRVAVRFDGIEQATAADEPRPDLERAGIGAGVGGFRIRLGAVPAAGSHAVLARVEGTTDTVPLAPGFRVVDAAGRPRADIVLHASDAPERPEPPAPAPGPAADPPAAAASALTGPDGWLFGLGEDDARRLSALRSLVDDLQATAAQLDQLHIRYVVAVVPPKLAVHLERASMPVAGLGRAAPGLAALARDSDSLEVFDLLDVLHDARRHGVLYEPQDELLSALGAFHVQRALVKRAGIGTGLQALPLERATLAPALEPPAGALRGRPTVGAARAGEAARPEGIDAATLRAQRVPAPSHLELDGVAPARVFERPDALDLPRAVLIGHQVIDAIAPWLAETTRRLVVMSTPTAVLTPLELEHPAVVFHVLEDQRLLD